MPPKRVYLVRHAQALHNVAEDYSIHDPVLTKLGREQAHSIQSKLSKTTEKVQLIISSPLKRTLETTLIGFKCLLDRGVPLIILPEAQECNEHPCDTGSDRAVLEDIDDFKFLDLSRLTPDWNSKQGKWAATPAALRARAQWVREFIKGRPEEEIVLVSHGDHLRYLCDYDMTQAWLNVECRAFSFIPNDPESRLERV